MTTRTILLALALAVVPASAHARQADTTCTCARELAWASDHLARNYSGFADKVNDTTRAAYDSLLVSLRAQAARATTGAECNTVLTRWIAWFRDGHVGLARPGVAPTAGSAAATPDEIRARFAAWERLDVGDEAAVRERLDAAGAALDAIEGIYVSADGSYRVAVVRDTQPGRAFAMVILKADSVYWMPGQVKATFARGEDGAYPARFFMQDHGERQWTARTTGAGLAFSGSAGPWLRRWPARDTVSVARYRASMNTRFDAREVAPGTVVVSIPTFGDPVRMDSLWAVHGALIRRAERLVIDVRGNGGGSDYNFQRFRALLYTDPVVSPGHRVLATDDNMRSNERLLADTTIPKQQREWIGNALERARKGRGPDGWFQGASDRWTADRVLERPREVAIVHDRGCASSCEGFVLVALQSRKVTTYGTNTAGVFDYGNVREHRAPCGTLVLRHATTRTGRTQRIDNVGIDPEVRIPEAEAFPVEWVLRRMAPGGATSR